MNSTDFSVTAVALPEAASIRTIYASTDLADAYAIRLPAHASSDPEQLARLILSNQAPWVGQLMRMRDAIVGRLGIKTAQQLQNAPDAAMGGRIYMFKIYAKTAHEVVLGEDDSHLDFRLSVLHEPATTAAGSTPRLIVSTVVHCHNRLGRAYIALIAPFHRAVVQSALRRAARSGWPVALTSPAPPTRGAPWTH
ncbi:MAG: DUF2867 domain-containing protein [Bacteriovorax sp.]|nr:DUF2867 domain-containing protein [Rhizobacter sp.]